MSVCRRCHVLRSIACLVCMILLIGGVGCSSSPTTEQSRSPIDEEFDRLNRAARIAFDYGKLRQALELYNQALERAYVLDDLNAIVDSKYNQAVCLTGLGSYDTALERVIQTKAELTRANQSIPADILLLEAIILYRSGTLDDAWQLSDRILMNSNSPSAVVRSKVHFLRGLIAGEWGDIDRLRNEIAALGKPGTSGLRADREELLGRLSAAEGNWNEAIEAFDRTAELRREDFDYREMVNALALAAWACEQAGKLSEASKRYLRAGRSASLQGEDRDALNWLDRAEKLAGKAGDEPTARQVRTYRKWIQEPQPSLGNDGRR